MWCIPCGQVVCYKEKFTATKHIKGAEHKKNTERMKQGVTRPGHSAEVKSPQQVDLASATSSPLASCTPCPPQPAAKQVDLKSMLDGISENQTFGDDFTAAFLQKGIPPNKLQHPAIQGLMRKYTKVHGCIGGKNEMYKSARRARKVHKGAVRAKLDAKKCWVGVHEWMDEQGHAIANVLIGAGQAASFAGGRSSLFMVACDGRSD